MHAVISRKGQWFFIERDMSEKWPTLFEIRCKRTIYKGRAKKGTYNFVECPKNDTFP